jgi:hypothetical protein
VRNSEPHFQGKDIMPPQFHADQAQPDQAQPGYDAQPGHGTGPGTAAAGSQVSRRSLLRGAAGVGAVGLVAATGTGAAFAATRPAAARPTAAAKPATLDATTEHAGAEPLVVYLRDLKTGEVEVFNGTSQVRVRSPKLVAQLMADLQTAQ